MATSLSTANQLCTYLHRCSFSSSSYGVSSSSLSSANFHSVQQQRRLPLLPSPTSLLRFSFLSHTINVQTCSIGASFVARAEKKANTPDSAPYPPPPVANEKDGPYEELMPKSGTCDPLCSLDEWSSEDFETNYQPKTDMQKAATILALVVAGGIALNHSWVAANQDVAMSLLFALGYAGIIFEESLAFNKSGVGLLMAVCLWIIRSIGAPSHEIALTELNHSLGEVSEIVFFLLGAMTIVEIIDAHQGFKLVTDNITTRKPRILLWVVGFVTFFLSSVLDNLTSTIVMISLLRKLVPPSEYRKLLGAVVVIAANAGGAWTPIGDVTTTMLWIHGQISALQTMKV